MTWLNNLLDLLFPPLCLRCENEGTWLCPPCRAKVPHALTRPPLRPFSNTPETFSCFRFSEPWVSKLIHRIKFGGSFAYLSPIAHILVERLAVEHTSFDAITFVPLHKKRKRERGFDQAELLARHVAHQLGIPFRPLLRRVKHTHAQAELSVDTRRENVVGAFQPNAQVDILPNFAYEERSVLLIDDVVTTGATLAAASTILKAFGIERVTAITIAYADK